MPSSGKEIMMDKRKIAVATAGIVVACGISVGAQYASQLPTSKLLIDQITGMVKTEKDKNATLTDDKEKYTTALSNFYSVLNEPLPSDISTITDSKVRELLTDYAHNNISETDRNYIKQQATTQVFSELSNELNETVGSTADVVTYVNNIKKENTSSNSKYLNTLKAIYVSIGKTNISDEDLLAKSNTDITTDITAYVNKVAKSSADTREATVKQSIANDLATALGMEEKEGGYTINEVVNEATSIASAYSELQMDYANAEADMQDTISYLRQQIKDLGETPCK